MKYKNNTYILLALFGFSGVATLIYEVLWARQLELYFGTSAHSITAILFVFFAGLALGSFLAGRFLDFHKIKFLKIYALLEIGIGMYALFTPFIFSTINTLQISLTPTDTSFLWLTVIRYALLFIALIIPTTLMGATLPVMTKFFTQRQEIFGSRFGLLYSINTFGGILGVLLVGFVFIALFGMRSTLLIAVLLNIVIALIAFSISSITEQRIAQEQTPVQRKDSREKNTSTSMNRGVILFSFFLAGFASIALEVLWTRTLVMIIGNSVYAFSIVLAVFLFGIASGSAIISRKVDYFKNPLRKLIHIELGIGIAVFLSVLLFYNLPLLFLKVFEISNGGFLLLTFLQFFLVAIPIILPTMLMGMAFPIVAKLYLRDISWTGRSVGYVYSINTFGGIFGPLFATFLFIPLIGIQNSIFFMSILYMGIGLLLLVTHHKKNTVRSLKWPITITVILLISMFLTKPWDKRIIDSGVYVNAREYLATEEESLRDTLEGTELIYYEEGLSSTVSVEEYTNTSGITTLALRINGKTDASTGGDMNTQILLGSLPYLLHPDPKDVLVVGLGSGITVGSLLSYPVKEVDVVEIEPAVVTASDFFIETNGNALDDPRVNLIVDDARHFLHIGDKKYDVISAEPSNPWISGVSHLFTKEQFELYKSRLNDGGMVVQWTHTYSMSEQDLNTILATFKSVFPNVFVWHNSDAKDIFLIGSQKPLDFDFNRIKSVLENPDIDTNLKRGGLNDPFTILSFFAFTLEAIDTPLHTDNHPIIEFSAPKNLYLDSTAANIRWLIEGRQSAKKIFNNISDEELIILNRYEEGVVAGLSAEMLIQATIEPIPAGNIIALYEAVLKVNPNNYRIRSLLFDILYLRGNERIRRGLFSEARKDLEKALILKPNHPGLEEDLRVLE